MTDAELAELVSKLFDPLLVATLEGEVVAANVRAERLVGRPREELSTLEALVADPEGARELLGRLARSGDPLPGSLELTTPSGKVPFRVDGVRVESEEGTRLLVRLTEKARGSLAFRELNEQVSQLGREIHRRRAAERRLEEQLGLVELIARGTPLSTVLLAVARFVEEESPDGAIASILLVEEGRLRHGAGPSLPAAYAEAIDGVAIGASVGSCGTAAHRGEAVVVEDIESDPLWADFAELALSHGLRACWSSPVLSPSGQVLATVAHYYREPRAPSAADLRLTDVARHLVGIAIERDLAERTLRDRAKTLVELDRRKNEFLAMLGHELRNPLSPMVSTVELLHRQGASEEDRGRWLGILEGQLRLLRRLVNDLLDMSRVTQGKIELRPSGMDLREVVEIVAAASADPRVHVRVPDEPVWVHGDSERLQQVLDNLVSNARKFAGEDGRIDLELRQEGGSVVLAVRDDGEGIAPEELPHVFDLFAQGERSLARTQGGLGIGLTLVRSLVEGHGGTIEARSAGRGRGCLMEVRLPASGPPAAEDAPASSPARRAEVADGEVGLEILVVDDDEDGAGLLGELLDGWGHRSRVAHDGPGAIEAVASRRPELVILDIGLPGDDGYAVARKLRGECGLTQESCLIVALTGYGRPTDHVDALAAGFDQFLVKPVDLDRLGSLVAERLERRPG